MTRRDIDRYIRNRTGVLTPAEREAQLNREVRFRQTPEQEHEDYPLGLELVPGFQAGNVTDVTALVTNTTYARYLGRASKGLNQLDVLYQVTTATVGAITWAEMAIGFSGDPVLQPVAATQDIQLLQYLDVSSRVNSTGRKKSEIIDLPQSLQGTHIWFLFGGQAATTQYQLRAGLADTIGAGFLYSAAARPSTMSGYVAFTNTSNTFADPWVAFKQRRV